MNICENCRCYHPVSGNNNYYGECCIGDTRNPIAVNADITGCCLFEPKLPKTNGDRIRQMTDEELAEWLDLHGECNQCAYHPAQCKIECNEGHLKWLRKEANEDAGTD